jgi:hypothetical protein
MPIVLPAGQPILNQVNPTSQPSSTQLNLRQMAGEVREWNPDVPGPLAVRWIQNAYRKIIDFRLWYGLLIRGQVVVPSVYATGTATFTLGSAQVTGVGTNWTQSMVNEQIRQGFSTGWYNIQSVQSATQLTLDLPWGNQTSSGGYQIVQTWVSLGPNIKRILEMVNQRQGWRMMLNMPQAVANLYDTWRTTTGWTYMCVSKEPRADGSPIWEFYPAPTFQQCFPYLAYVQPPDLQNDGDYPVTFVRSDILVLHGIKEALLYKGKNSRYYDPNTASSKVKEFEQELFKMALNDDNQYPKDFLWDFEKYPYYQYGSQYAQSHAGGPGEL